MILIVFAFNVILSLHFMSRDTMRTINDKADITVELLDDVDEFAVHSFIQDLQNLEEVKSVKYISKKDSLHDFENFFPDTGLVDFLEKYDEPNPFPANIVVIPRSINDNSRIIDFFKQPQQSYLINLDKLINNNDQKIRTEKLMIITDFVNKSGYILSITFIIIAILVIYNAIKVMVFIHANEIEIMRLVGARTNFIRSPFLIEGGLYGGVSVVLALGAVFMIFTQIENALMTETLISDLGFQTSFLSIFKFMQMNIFSIFVLEIFIGVLLGLISSYLAVSGYLKKSILQ